MWGGDVGLGARGRRLAWEVRGFVVFCEDSVAVRVEDYDCFMSGERDFNEGTGGGRVPVTA